MQSITETHFQFEGQTGFYRGKVRDVYYFDSKMVVIASDRISAFDVILPQPIPYKGQVLNQISAFFLQETASEVPNWLMSTPDPNVSIGLRCHPLPVEMVIRAYLVGSAWRAYKLGKREFNGHILPEGLNENAPLPYPIITPSTKAEQGQHDEEISSSEIVAKGLMDKNTLEQLESYTHTLFKKGTEIANSKGLILADTKYEFGIFENKIYLIDEIHTPDSSRYFDIAGYQTRQQNGEAQPQRSKEMVRQWLIQHGFKGEQGQEIPVMSDEWINAISNEYIALYEQLSGSTFIKTSYQDRLERMKMAIENEINLK